MRGMKRLLFASGAAIASICAATAVLCGVFIAVRGISPFDGRTELYAVGVRSDNAGTQRRSVRASGGAGVVTDGDFVISAVYSDAEDAKTVAEKSGLEVLAIECGDGDFEKAASQAAAETEMLWRELESGNISENYAADVLSDIAVRLNDGFSGNGEAISASAAVMCAAIDCVYPTAGNIRFASACLALAAAADDGREYMAAFNR